CSEVAAAARSLRASSAVSTATEMPSLATAAGAGAIAGLMYGWATVADLGRAGGGFAVRWFQPDGSSTGWTPRWGAVPSVTIRGSMATSAVYRQSTPNLSDVSTIWRSRVLSE